MKYIVIGDIHLGINNSSQEIYNLIHKPFFKWLISNYKSKDTSLIFLGDIFHSRRFISSFILYKTQKIFESLSKSFKEIYVLQGNHDFYYKEADNNYVNNVELVTSIFDNVKVIKQNQTIDNFFFIPFDNNPHPVSVEDVKDKVVFGHIETGDLFSNENNNNYIPVDVLSKSKYAMIGHYHNPSKDENVFYVGTPFLLQFPELKFSNNLDVLDLGVYVIDENLDYTYERYTNLENTFYFNIVVNDDKSLNKLTEFCDNNKKKNIRVFVTNGFYNSHISDFNSLSNYNNVIFNFVNKDEIEKIEDIEDIKIDNMEKLISIFLEKSDFCEKNNIKDVNIFKGFVLEKLKEYDKLYIDNVKE